MNSLSPIVVVAIAFGGWTAVALVLGFFIAAARLLEGRKP